MTDSAKHSLTADDLATALGAFVADAQPQTGIGEIDRLAQRAIGHRLFTVMVLHRASMQVERVYSSRPEAYPTGARKEKRDTEWGRMVLEDAVPFIGRDDEDIQAHFDDHETIKALGLSSILNMPIVYGGRVLGTMNLLHEDGHYTPSDIEPGQLLAAALLPAVCMLQTPG